MGLHRKCKQCSVSFSSEAQFQQHYDFCHRNVVRAKTLGKTGVDTVELHRGDGVFSCINGCSFRNRSAKAFKKHISTCSYVNPLRSVKKIKKNCIDKTTKLLNSDSWKVVDVSFTSTYWFNTPTAGSDAWESVRKLVPMLIYVTGAWGLHLLICRRCVVALEKDDVIDHLYQCHRKTVDKLDDKFFDKLNDALELMVVHSAKAFKRFINLSGLWIRPFPFFNVARNCALCCEKFFRDPGALTNHQKKFSAENHCDKSTFVDVQTIRWAEGTSLEFKVDCTGLTAIDDGN
ncbi:hypothetical protein SJAG_05358 [Schizosaccharomyces japonicus yFS275]|uniref:C2H2-type domain-containing protein n=1 Tax=Schizosaccharomyces japonicus (strain yFS275 / FY16936) TaxID=402676 RepID=T0S1F3_SCHJY|nr:hypothetical protein SJAG_05358 [Schizosaccharomyces japonicus yFS275]EQC53077.1 hypothetical protein SJAG_05358 [Schizosaccharomyces japonicus yFS275]